MVNWIIFIASIGCTGKEENALAIDAMKIIQFTIPATKEKSIRVQEDDLPHFYE